MKRSRLKPTGFKPRKPLNRGGARLAREGNYRRHARLRAVGNNSGSNDWRRAWRKLKPEFGRAGIDCCEECGSKYFLTPAHTLKRRHITNEFELNEVAILCRTCHEKYELQGEEKMCAAIRAIIARRDERRLEAA